MQSEIQEPIITRPVQQCATSDAKKPETTPLPESEKNKISKNPNPKNSTKGVTSDKENQPNKNTLETTTPLPDAVNKIFHFWKTRSRSGSNSNNNKLKPDYGQEGIRRLSDEKSRSAKAWDNWKRLTVMVERAVLMRQIEKRKNFTDFKRNDSGTRVNWSVVDDNLVHLKVICEDVKKFYLKHGEYEYLEGRIVSVIDQEGLIHDTCHHIFPVIGKDPDLFSDEIFESWYMTCSLFEKAIAGNSELQPLAQRYCQKPKFAKKQGKSELVVVEFTIYLNNDGSFRYCMIGFYDDLGMGLNSAQTHTILATLNKFNNSEKKSINAFRIPTRVVCPQVLGLLTWRKNQGLVKPIRYQKRMKFYMEVISDYLMHLYEKATSGVNLGLRSLLIQESLLVH